MKSIRSSLPVLSPAGLRGSMLMRGLADSPFIARELDCLVDIFLPMEEEEPFGDIRPLPLMLRKGCGAFSWPGEGPVDRIKSAKSRMDSDSMRGSLACGLVITFLLGEGLWLGTPGPLPPLPLLLVLGGLIGTAALFLSASTRGYAATKAVAERSGSALRTIGDSCLY